MKNLKDIILEKLKIDDIVLGEKFPINEKFPIDGNVDDIIEFLEDAGFKKVPSYPTWESTLKNYKKYDIKCFGVEKGVYTFIEIIDRSNSRFKNKLFCIKLNSKINIYNIFDDINTTKRAKYARQVSKEEFLEELSKIL